jgi:hypothetical protein
MGHSQENDALYGELSQAYARRERPNAGFVVGGRGLTARMRTRPRIDVCARVSEVVDAVDALVHRADLN